MRLLLTGSRGLYSRLASEYFFLLLGCPVRELIVSHSERTTLISLDEGVCFEPEGLSILEFFGCAVALSIPSDILQVLVIN